MIENPACDGNKMTGVGTWRTCRGQSATSPSGSCSWKKGVFAKKVLPPFFIFIGILLLRHKISLFSLLDQSFFIFLFYKVA